MVGLTATGVNRQYERDVETGLDGARFYDSDVASFLSLDPLAAEFPEWSAYNYVLGNPLRFIDPDGRSATGDYYDTDGTWLGSDGKKDSKVYVKDSEGDVSYGTSFLRDGGGDFTELDVTKEELIAFAAVIHKESSGNKQESLAIGNVTMNFLKEGGSRSLNTLEDVVLYRNSFARGATQGNYTSFKSYSGAKKNSKYAMSSAINALGFQQGISSFKDYSGGADSWDGIDLVDTKRSNDHRKYTWSNDSKELLLKYKKERKGGVKVENFTYKERGFQIKATKIIGSTLYTNLQTGRGERKTNKQRFK